MKTKNKTIIIAGINGDLGSEFAKRLVKSGKVYGLSRSPKKFGLNYHHICTNLLDQNETSKALREIEPTDNLIYLHLVGKFKFEDEHHPTIDTNSDGIDDAIYDTNVTTFQNVQTYLTTYLAENLKARLKLVGIGSTSDLYRSPFWHSFTRSKDNLRKEFRKIYGNPASFGRVGSLFINVSTVAGSQLANERPFISPQFCLSPKEVVKQSTPFILENRVNSLELSIIEPNPNFSTPDYLSYEKTKQRWYREMYGSLESEKN